MLGDSGMQTEHEIDHDTRLTRLQILTRELAELSPVSPYSVSRAHQLTTEIKELLAAERRYTGACITRAR
jgi:hypothetical protein